MRNMKGEESMAYDRHGQESVNDMGLSKEELADAARSLGQGPLESALGAAWVRLNRAMTGLIQVVIRGCRSGVCKLGYDVGSFPR